MEVTNVPTSELRGMTAPYNPRTISDHDLTALARSMTSFGVVEPVVVNKRTGRIVGGHQRVKAAEGAGIESLPVVYVDLDEAAEKQLNLALNRISGEFDLDKLADLLKELEAEGADLDLTGFTNTEIDDLIRGLEKPEEGLTDPDLIPEPPDEPATQRGDLIYLGRHRLLCGDSASATDVAKLLDGERIHLVNTDPPYNVSVEPRSNNAIAAAGKGRKHHQNFDLARQPGKKPTGKLRARDRVLENDFVTPEEFDQLLRAWFQNAADALEPGRSFYFWGGYANVANYPSALEATELYFSQAIIWVKDWPVLTRKDYMGNHEWCFYGWKKGTAHYFNPGITNAPDVWTVRKVTPQAMVHLTEKPVELAERAMMYSSRKDENVLDLFGGSGSTLMAAERMRRRAFLVEIDPAYCDVIVQRWQAPIRVRRPTAGEATSEMGRHSKKTRERARELYLTGDVSSVAEIARRLKVKAHTVGTWKKEEDWDALRLKIEKRAAEQMAERIASDRVELNERHFKGWSVIFGQVFEKMQNGGLDTEQIRNLERVAAILDRAQKGQRLARGLSLDGHTEEQIRAEAEAENRALVDLFVEVVKEHVDDDETRDQISRAIMERLPNEDDASADPAA